MVDLTEYGFTPAEILAAGTAADGSLPGRVIETRRGLYRVITEAGELPAELKGSFYHTMVLGEQVPATGDFVLLHRNPSGNSLIAALLPRRSGFSRADFSGHEEGYAKNIRAEVTAANFDYLFILLSLNQNYSVGRAARYLTAAKRSGAFPALILSKADLSSDPEGAARELRSIAREAPVIPLSVRTGYGLGALAPFLEPGRTVIFLGSSGVGKSSLLNALAGETLAEVREIRDEDGKGRHTTTHRQLFRLPSGALVIDTPGMRELGLWDSSESLSLVFGEVEDLIARCRFSNCRHQTEPGCAVRAALEDGSLSPAEWRNYQAQKREAAFVRDHSAYLKQKEEFHRALSRMNRTRRKGGKDLLDEE